MRRGRAKSMFIRLIERTKPLVWRIAGAYDIRINKHCVAQGRHPLIIEDPETAKGRIPKSVYFNTGCGKIVVGEDTVFGENVMLLTGKHYNIHESEQERVALHYVPKDGRDIIVGKGCYIGSGAIIIGPVKIGDFAVISAGSVVVRDVPERTVVAGNPARPFMRLDHPDGAEIQK